MSGDEFYDDDVTSGIEEDGWALPPIDKADGGKLRVMAEMCATCIFRPGNPMSLAPGRVASMLRGVRSDDSYVTCHKTLGTGQPGAICKGSSVAHTGQLERIARRLGAVLEVAP